MSTAQQRAQDRYDMALAYRQGKSVRDIAAASSRSYGYVHARLTEAEVRMRPRGRRPR